MLYSCTHMATVGIKELIRLQVPENFRFVVQATLREFYLSIAAEKDLEQSWKKAIYKVIARMDDTIPEYFKSPNWMQQLVDA